MHNLNKEMKLQPLLFKVSSPGTVF